MPVVATSLLPILLLALAIAIAAKPALVSERKLPMTFPLTRRRSFANYNVVESERRRLKSLGRREGNHDSLTQALFDTKALAYYITVAVGSSLCKWLQYLTADEEIPTGSFSKDDLRIDSTRWADNVRLLHWHARHKCFFTAGPLGLEQNVPTSQQVQAWRQTTRWWVGSSCPHALFFCWVIEPTVC